MSDIFLGAWTTPSGNHAEAYLKPYNGIYANVEFRWDHVPEGEWAFDAKDLAYYRETILPEATQAALPHTTRQAQWDREHTKHNRILKRMAEEMAEE